MSNLPNQKRILVKEAIAIKNIANIKNHMNIINWDHIYNANTIELQFDCFINNIINIFNQSFPIESIKK